MKLASVANNWERCPQQGLRNRGALVEAWAGHWDWRVSCVERTGTYEPILDLGKWTGCWAQELAAENGKPAARDVLRRLRKIRKEADISPEQAERWNDVLLPFIQASERALARAIGVSESA